MWLGPELSVRLGETSQAELQLYYTGLAFVKLKSFVHPDWSVWRSLELLRLRARFLSRTRTLKAFVTCELSMVTSMFFSLPIRFFSQLYTERRNFLICVHTLKILLGFLWNGSFLLFLAYRCLCEHSGKEWVFFPLRNTSYEIIR